MEQNQEIFLTIHDDTKIVPKFGELFITNQELLGGIDSLRHFKGRLVTNVCGGSKKLFVIEEEFDDGIISTLHAPEYDDLEYTYSEEGRTAKNLEEIFAAFENKGQIKRISCGKKMTIILTEEGKLYSYGIGEYGSLGHGGEVFCQVPRPINKISNQRIVQVACGECHCLALTSSHSLYSWGRGFEGQLGLKQTSASVPTHVSYFYQGFDHEKREDKKIKLVHVAAGSYHSMVIDEFGSLYVWGEAKLGQCGNGKKSQENQPKIVNLSAQTDDVDKQTNIKINPFEQRPVQGFRVKTVSGGFAHTAAITESGELYTWGFNVNGQLGLGDTKSRYYPTRITKDMLGNQIPLFSRVQCGHSNTFAIDEQGFAWSWGGGNLGHKNDHKQDLPRKIVDNTENRRFSEIYAVDNATTFFAPMRIMSVRPNNGPSSGGTLISLLGTGFADTSKQSLRFLFGSKSAEVGLNYDPSTESFNCLTPNFNEISEDELKWPIKCSLEVTLDGKIYSPCETEFLIYSSKLAVQSINPKTASVKGGTLGFQKKKQKDDKMKASKASQDNNTPRIPGKNQIPAQFPETKQINPLDLSTNDPELEKENFICVEGEYHEGKITCIVPTLDDNQSDQLHYNVDVSLNGQQFTNQPSSFRFYDISIKSLSPNNDIAQGGATVNIKGEGFIDTLNKKIKLETSVGSRLRDVNWDKLKKQFSFVVPPASWLLGGEDGNLEYLNLIFEKGVDVKLTLNGFEWIHVAQFRYIELNIERFGPVAHDMSADNWTKPEPEIDHFEGLKEEADIEKKKAEIKQKIEEEQHEMETLFKKTGQYLYIYGQNFITGENYMQFLYNGQAKVVKGVYKNTKKLGIQIPELEGLAPGIQDVGIEVSFNGQQFSTAGKTFRYMAFDKNWTPQEKQKFEDEELKKLKLPAKKGGKK